MRASLRVGIVPIVVAVGLALMILDENSGLAAWWQLRGTVHEARGRIDLLSQDVAALRAKMQAFEDEPFSVERSIREDLMMARPGDTVVRFRSGARRPRKGGP